MIISFNLGTAKNQLYAWETAITSTITQKASRASMGTLKLSQNILTPLVPISFLYMAYKSISYFTNPELNNTPYLLVPTLLAIIKLNKIIICAQDIKIAAQEKADFNTLKKKVCKALFNQAKKMGLTKTTRKAIASSLTKITLQFKHTYPLANDEEIKLFATKLLLPFSSTGPSDKKDLAFLQNFS